MTRSRRWGSASGSPSCTQGGFASSGGQRPCTTIRPTCSSRRFFGSPPMNLVQHDGRAWASAPSICWPVDEVPTATASHMSLTIAARWSTSRATVTSTALSAASANETNVIARLPATVTTPLAAGRKARVRRCTPERMQVLRRRQWLADRPCTDRRLTMSNCSRTRQARVPTGQPVPARGGSRRPRGLPRRLCLLPSVVYIVALVAVPFFLSIAFSLSDVTAGDPGFDWAGFRNFQRIFHDPVFWRSLQNTLRLHARSRWSLSWSSARFSPSSLSLISGVSGSCASLYCCPGPRRCPCRRSRGCGCSTPSTARSTGCCGSSA